MNVQDAKELNITEGDVRTIHDSDGRQLWGRLAYDVKYEGDTTQQTYTGKNLINLPTVTRSESGIDWEISDSIHAVGSGTADSNAGSYLITGYKNIEFDITGNFTFSISSSINAPLYCRFYDSSNTNLGQLAITSGNTSVSGTIPSDATKYRILLAPTNGTTYDIDIYLQLEKGSVPTTIEPYVGGIPAPNPDYPQTVNVVTGTQTITLTDGVVSDDFTLGLGSTELCKIGDYQDYIYKSGDDWYVHKETNKVVLDGTEPTWSRLTLSGVTRYFTVDELDALIITNTNVVSPIISNNFTSQSPSDVYTAAVPYGISLNSNTAKFRIRNKDFSEIADFTNWLSTHNTTVYYALATPTDTQITDATLIGQLDAIHQFLTRYGYSSSVSGNLPMIINQTALS